MAQWSSARQVSRAQWARFRVRRHRGKPFLCAIGHVVRARRVMRVENNTTLRMIGIVGYRVPETTDQATGTRYCTVQ